MLLSTVAAGIFHGSIAVVDRDEACVVGRAILVSNDDPELRPRRRDPFTGVDEGEDNGAFLQQDLHAEPLFKHFLDHFEARAQAPLPM